MIMPSGAPCWSSTPLLHSNPKNNQFLQLHISNDLISPPLPPFPIWFQAQKHSDPSSSGTSGVNGCGEGKGGVSSGENLAHEATDMGALFFLFCKYASGEGGYREGVPHDAMHTLAPQGSLHIQTQTCLRNKNPSRSQKQRDNCRIKSLNTTGCIKSCTC